MARLSSKESRAKRRRAQSFESLVQAGLATIAERGLYGTTVEHITEAADVGKGTFYAHFPSKEELLHHLVRHGFNELIVAGRTALPLNRPPADRLATLIQAQLCILSRRRDLVILLHQVRGLLIRQPEERPSLRREYMRYLQFLTEECQQILGRPNLGREEARDLACAIAGFVAGTISFEMLARGGRGLKISSKGAVNAFAAGVAARYAAPRRRGNGSRPS